MVTILISPTSRKSIQIVIYHIYSHEPALGGTITLRNNDPFQPPLIDPQYMTTDFDTFAVRESIKAASRFVGAPAWSDYVVGPFGRVFGDATNDSLIESYARGVAGSAFHAVGTAAMSAVNDNWGVVNHDLTVKGTDGLRIVDASVFVSGSHLKRTVWILTVYSPLFRAVILKAPYICWRKGLQILLKRQGSKFALSGSSKKSGL